MTDQSIRSLVNLQGSASTARVLNLSRVDLEHGQTEAWRGAPLFQNAVLNRCMILKHRIRRDEADCFRQRRSVATKIILPTDARDLRAGGRYIFVDQDGFQPAMTQVFGLKSDHPDLRTLRLMDALPGLDPFLLREQLRRHGISPAACYFNLSERDMKAMTAFVAEEIAPLVDLSLGPDAKFAAEDPVARLSGKILSSSAGDDLSLLGKTLRLAPEESEEGVFCWKGFLYYKWVLRGVIGDVGPVLQGVRSLKPRGRPTAPQRVVLARSRDVVARRIISTCETTAGMLSIYDNAFAGLTKDGRPTAFRDFLRNAPHLFFKLGEHLGGVQHIISFWKFRTGEGQPPLMPEELIELLADFEASLAGAEPDSDALSLAA